MTLSRRSTVIAAVLLAGACDSAPASPPAPTEIPWPSPADLGTIRGVINSRAGDQLSMIGLGKGTVVVGLRAGASGLAKQIVDAYGDAVDVTVGFFSYPGNALINNGCAIPWKLVEPRGLRASVEMASPAIESGTTFDATVRISNVDTRTITVQTSSSLQVYLFPPGGTQPVGAFDLSVAGEGRTMSVEPGTSVTLPGYGGTASCDLSLGYALRAGSYDARALVDFALGPEGGNGPIIFWSDPLAVEVVAPRT